MAAASTAYGQSCCLLMRTGRSSRTVAAVRARRLPYVTLCLASESHRWVVATVTSSPKPSTIPRQHLQLHPRLLSCTAPTCGRSSNRRLLLAADDAGTLLLLLAASGRVLQQQVLDAGTPLAMHLHGEWRVESHACSLSLQHQATANSNAAPRPVMFLLHRIRSPAAAITCAVCSQLPGGGADQLCCCCGAAQAGPIPRPPQL